MVDRQNGARHDFRILQVNVGMLKEKYPPGYCMYRIYRIYNNHPVNGVVSACAIQLCSTCGIDISGGAIPDRFGACISCEGVCVLGAKPT